MHSSVSFKAKARTIDHLGKGQIADTPTAVSELWKNSFDAYARDVALHTFDDDIKCGAIIDNGCGMTFKQVIDNWLVIGTNSKTTKNVLPEADRFGLPNRSTQGEKGIGRLSAAFLSPITLLVTKKTNTKYSAVLIDWRLFENPYLSLDDIKVPVAEFDALHDLDEMFEELLAELKANLCIHAVPENQDAPVKDKQIRQSWIDFTKDELHLNDDLYFVPTEKKVLEFCESFEFDAFIMESWKPQLEKVKKLDGDEHGTALFLLDLNRELSLLTNRQDKAADDLELLDIQSTLIDTLKAFTDPYFERTDFSYEIRTFDIGGKSKNILNSFDVFNYEDFCSLEHRVEGLVDEKGWFRGKVTTFGKHIENVIIPPSFSFDSGLSQCGPFSIKLGTYEMESTKSSLSEAEHSKLRDRAGADAGILIFRDQLRVLPYGRSDYDFFQIEERRGKNAGRYFWANRRTWGHIGLDQVNNRKLRDKAGREGFIRNQAAREFKELVKSHLISLADKFFGSKSDERKNVLSILAKEKQARKSAQTKAKTQSQTTFRNELKSKRPQLEEAIAPTRKIYQRLKDNTDISTNELIEINESLSQIEKQRGELKTPIKPPKVNEKQEVPYREYRDLYNEFSEMIAYADERLNSIQLLLSNQSPLERIQQKFNQRQGLLNGQVSKYEKLIASKLDTLSSIWRTQAGEDRSRFHEQAISILDNSSEQDSAEINLNLIDSIYTNLADSFTIKYEAILRAFDRLEQGINLDSAFSMAEEEKAYFEDKAKKLQSLAQLGISVEVMAHELEQLDLLVTRGLNSLPTETKSHPGFTTAYDAHKSLTQQIRFLSPLKLSGYQMRQDITGDMIKSHVNRFFRDRFERQRVELIFGDTFKSIVIRDLPSRIYPVFVNIINNALYWVSLSEVRKIEITLKDNKVVIGNTGPKVDEDDIPRLFELFYSRRSNGHGVGLYLCRENLAVAHHKIWYAQDKDEMVFEEGANFVIEFNGMERK
ncbi:ATP-binding protein [Shewanella sp. 202IG2-18]|uniref:ATP-binding protein n=1 Tax=Parashewanella hymeniacidonis TaxID=2807618 RepID=UPI00196193ED|nr:ATP-binding protein [Parashewanella hymeniacidonis]MBM7073997.1 ATP-binding protein [Parashewanella hymeniacidonis]